MQTLFPPGLWLISLSWLISLPLQSRADIVHVPNANLNFSCCQEPDGFGGGFTLLDVDIDRNGSTEFSFLADRFADFGFSDTFYDLSGVNGRVVESGGAIAVLDSNAPINSSATFGNGGELYHVFRDFGFVDAGGPWYQVQNGYMGFDFEIDGNRHFGWMRVSTLGGNRIHEWAYQSTPGAPIAAGQVEIPEPASILLIAGLAVGGALTRFGSGRATRLRATEERVFRLHPRARAAIPRRDR